MSKKLIAGVLAGIILIVLVSGSFSFPEEEQRNAEKESSSTPTRENKIDSEILEWVDQKVKERKKELEREEAIHPEIRRDAEKIKKEMMKENKAESPLQQRLNEIEVTKDSSVLQVIARTCENPMEILPTLERECEYEIRNNSEEEIVWEAEPQVCLRPIGEYWERCSSERNWDRDINVLIFDLTTREGIRTDIDAEEENFMLKPFESVSVRMKFVVPDDSRVVERVQRHMEVGTSMTNMEGEFTFKAEEVQWREKAYREPRWTPSDDLILSLYSERDECNNAQLDQTDRSVKCLFFVTNTAAQETKRYELLVEVCYWLLGGEKHCTDRFDGEIRLGINPLLVPKDERGMRDQYEVEVTSSRQVENEVRLQLKPGERHSIIVHAINLHDTESFQETTETVSDEKKVQFQSQKAIPTVKGELQVLLKPRS